MNDITIRQHSQNNKLYFPNTEWEHFPKEKTWARYKQASKSIADTLDLYPASATNAHKIRNCANRIRSPYTVDSETGEIRYLFSLREWACHDRVCPICRWRKSLERQAQFHAALPFIKAKCRLISFLSLSLTVRNCNIADLRTTHRAMLKAWARFVKHPKLKRIVKGWLRVTEITRSNDGDAHPHLHCIFAVHGFYYKSIAPDEWQPVWQECLGVTSAVQVDVSVRSNNKSLNESITYTLKVQSMENIAKDIEGINYFIMFYEQTKNMRTFDTGGIFKDAFKKAKEDFNSKKKSHVLEPISNNVDMFAFNEMIGEGEYIHQYGLESSNNILDNIYK